MTNKTLLFTTTSTLLLVVVLFLTKSNLDDIEQHSDAITKE